MVVDTMVVLDLYSIALYRPYKGYIGLVQGYIGLVQGYTVLVQ